MIVRQMIINQDMPVFIFNVTHPRLQITRMNVQHITMKVNSPLRAGNAGLVFHLLSFCRATPLQIISAFHVKKRFSWY